MSAISRSLARLRWTRDREAEIADEIEAHIEEMTEALIASGHSADEARRRARIGFGNKSLILEDSREVWIIGWLDAILRDLRFAWRLACRQPGLTAAVILTVALGVGANTAITSVLDTILLNPLGLTDTKTVTAVRVHVDRLQMRNAEASGVEFREVRAMADVFSATAAMEGRAWSSELGGEPVRLVGQAVTPDFFRVFAQQPLLGRFFEPADSAVPHAEEGHVIVLSHRLWRAAFAADPSVLGRTLHLDGKSFEIVGVASPDFHFPANAEVWVPLVLAPERMDPRNRGDNMTLSVFARLRNGVTIGQAADRINRYVATLRPGSSPDELDTAKLGFGIDLLPFAPWIAGDLRRPLWLLWAASLTLLLGGCANVTGLLLARASSRRREIAIRISLGAGRTQILRQLIIESILSGLAGGLAGLGLTAIAVAVLRQLSIPGRDSLGLVSLNWPLLGYGIAIALMSAILFGTIPALQLLRDNQSAAMARTARHKLQGGFILAQIAGALVLAIVTALLTKSLRNVQEIRPGFDSHNVTTAFFIRPQNDPAFLHNVEAALHARPGVESAALAYPLPFSSGGLTNLFSIKGRQHNAGEPEWHVEAYFVSPGYFDTLRIPLISGRKLADSDADGAPIVCVIDAGLARRFFPHADPLGQEVAMYKGWARIVGVVASIRDSGLEDDSKPVIYYSLAQMPFYPQRAALVRSATPGSPLIRDAVRKANPGAPVFDVRTMDARIAESFAIRSTLAWLIAGFGVISGLLAAIGVNGVVARFVAERRTEIGIRMALGAQPGQIVSRFLAQGLRPALAGIAAGLVIALSSGKLLQSYLYEVSARDPMLLGGAVAGVLLVLLTAMLWPSLRAARIDPQDVLRSE